MTRFAKKQTPETRTGIVSKSNAIPLELQRVLTHLSPGCKLAAFKTWQMGWTATIAFSRGNRRFRLVSDRGYVDAYDISSGKEHHLFPPKDQRVAISPSQVASLIHTALQTGCRLVNSIGNRWHLIIAKHPESIRT